MRIGGFIANSTNNEAHLQLTGNPSVAAPVNGDVWLTGAEVNARLSGTTVNLAAPNNLTIPSQAQGDVIYFNGTIWTRLGAGTAGQVLRTEGAGANPTFGFPTSLTIASQAQGDVLYYNGTTWTRLGAGTAGQVLRTEGAGANPTFGYPASLTIASQAQGDIIYYNGSAWVRLPAGTSGQKLQTNGTGANPSWVTAGASAMTFISNTSFSAATDTGSITIAVSKLYRIYVEIEQTGSAGALDFRINAGTGNTRYSYDKVECDATPTATTTGVTAGSDYQISGSENLLNTNGFWQGIIDLDTTRRSSEVDATIHVHGLFVNNSTVRFRIELQGIWDSGVAATSFQLNVGGSMTGNVYLYEISKS